MVSLPTRHRRMGFQVLSLLLLFIYPLCSANTYYVTPTADTPCPGEPCFSLSEYFREQAGHIFTSNLTFIFLPGNHTIEMNIPIVDLTSLSLLGDSSSLPELTSIVICTQPFIFTFSQLSELSISNIGFSSCGDLANAPIRLEQVLQAEISNCLFQDGQNGALSVVDSTVILLENRFENNSATIGGGLYIDRSVVNLARNIFMANYAEVNGSGVYIESGHQSESTVSFTENSFIENSADGSGLYIESGRHSTVSFTENSFIRNSGDGVVVFVGYSNEVMFTDNEFLNNSGSDFVYENSVQISTFYVKPTPNTPRPAEPCHTLAEYVLQPNEYFTLNVMLQFLPGNYTLETSIFLEGLNILIISGDSSSLPHVTSRIICSQPASIIFNYVSELHITDMALISCGDLTDTSIRISQVGQAEISSCIFQGKKSGALAIVDSLVILFNNTFESNNATYGGGVYIDRSTVNFTTNIVAFDNGAGVFVQPQRPSSVTFIRNSFINNRGGGATIYVDHSSEITTFTGNIFVNNTADKYAVYGSTIEEASIYYVTPALDIPCPLQPCHTLSHYITESHQYFTSNTTLVFIPGNHTLEKGLLIRDITRLAMLGNSSTLISSNIVCSTNKPESFTFHNISEVHIHSLAFISCGSSSVGAAVSLNVIYLANISSCTFYNNINRNDYSDIGGALAVVNSTLTLSETTFTNNSAISTHGGGLYTEKSNVTVIGNTFVNNSASGWGGGAYTEDSMVPFVSNLFSDNIASYGGGVQVYNSMVNFTEDTVINNVAGIDGGGLDIYGTTGHFERIIIQNNMARRAGGGVCVYLESRVSFSEGTFMFNTAREDGGCILVSTLTSILNVSESNLTNNSAGSRGGGAYLVGGTFNFHMNNIISNSATFNGGGVFVESSHTANLNFTNNTFESNQGGGWVVFVDSTNTTFTENVLANNSGNAVYETSKEYYYYSIFYVTPSPSTRCLAEPCHTFSEYIDQISQYLRPKTIFVFLPGNHSVSSGLLVDGISSLILYGASESPPLITCNKPVSFAFKNVVNLEIYSLVFDSCGDSIHAAVSIKSVHSATISRCSFMNSLGSGGALVVVNSTQLTLSDNVFENNSAIYGGGVYVSESVVDLKGNRLIKNSAENAGGGLLLLNCSVNLTGNAFFSSNSIIHTGGRIEIGNNDYEFRNGFKSTGGGAIFMSNSTLISLGNITFDKNNANYGGGLVVLGSDVYFSGFTKLQNNFAIESGGGIYASSASRLYFNGTTNFMENSATYGGGLYVLGSDIYFSGPTNLKSNFAANSGGGIYALSASRLYFNGRDNFTDNSASDGGGLQLTENSLCYFSSKAELNFIGNRVTKHGGAINNEDSTTSAYCSETSPSTTTISKCFFQVWTNVVLYSLSQITARMNFDNNTADEGGSDVYGGTVDNCKLNVIRVCQDFCNIKSSGDVFDIMTGGKLKASSIPLQVCSCDQQKVVLNCSNSPLVRVYPGSQFSVSVAAVGQRNGRVPSIIETTSSNSKITIADLQDVQKTSNKLMCTDLIFRVYIHSLSQRQQNSTLILNTNGPCPRELVVYVEVLECPHGFEIRDNDGQCDCGERLSRFTDECDIDTGTILKKSGSEFWVGYDNDSQGLILHPHCPFDYCKTEELYIEVDDNDAQCSYNRSGVLCGECGQNLSFVLGSSRCMQCSNSYLALLIPFAMAGILLVLLLFILRLTVAAGTLHGLIFYANIVQVNSAIFFSSGLGNPLTIFIAWLNLDLGIETCFYKGMDAYGKTWLQFVFPIYIWSLVVIIIFVSHYSTGKVARLFGRNPIAVLATLFLLSYAKLLRTVIAALSFTLLEYRGSLQVAVWGYDGNISYFSSKHIPLFIAAMVFLAFMFFPYTMLLVLGQWLQAKSDLKIFSWINSPRIKSFLDTYHAPYTDKHRYWTGLMLLVRFCLFLVSAMNTSGNPNIDLLVIAFASVPILLIVLGARIYKTWYLILLEITFILNLAIFAVASYITVVTNGNQNAVTFTSVSIAFATFTGIVIYHSIQQFKNTPRLRKILSKLALSPKTPGYTPKRSLGLDDEDSAERPLTAPSTSVIDIGEAHSYMLREPCMETNQ